MLLLLLLLRRRRSAARVASVASSAGAHRSLIFRCLPRDRASGVDGLEYIEFLRPVQPYDRRLGAPAALAAAAGARFECREENGVLAVIVVFQDDRSKRG